MARISRPNRLPPGATLSKHYTIEGLVRLAEGRMFYLANDHRPDQPTKFCWSCGETENPRENETCFSCNQPMEVRKFLVSIHWNPNFFESFESFFQKGLHHGAMIGTLDMFYEKGALCTIIPWNREEFLLNVCSPLQGTDVIDLAQRITGMLAYLHRNGVSLEEIHPRNFLVQQPHGKIVFFDPKIRRVYPGQVPEVERSRELLSLAETLRDLTSLTDLPIQQFLAAAEEGRFASPYEFGRSLEELASQYSPPELPNNLAAMSDVGLIRNLNEDNWGWTQINPTTKLYVVADGMGGHDRGEVASQMAVENICLETTRQIQNHELAPTIPELENILKSSFQYSNNSIKEHSEHMGSDMGTTMVCSLVVTEPNKTTAIVANVGDSRAYLVRAGTLHQISRDHSLVARMVEQKQLTPEEARTHPHSNILLRTVGTERNVSIDLFLIDIEPGDTILLCSDGLWGEVEDEDMRRIIVNNSNIRKSCQELLRASHLGGGRDNCTLVLVDF